MYIMCNEIMQLPLQQIRLKEARLVSLDHKLRNNEEQQELMSEFLKNVKKELENTEVSLSEYARF